MKDSNSRGTSDPVYVGLDMGSSRSKVVVIDDAGELLGHAVMRSGINFGKTGSTCLSAALEMAGVEFGDIARAVSTGYGRGNVGFVTQENKTEIGCLARGGYHYFPEAITVIDIGGQDNKIIKVDAAGNRMGFKMNRKCAAGTGAFLEEMSARLDVSLEEMNDLARAATEMIKLGSFCTVFSATEVLENIRNGKNVNDIVKGIFYSMIRRVLEMDSITERVVMTGGVVEHNAYMVEMVAEMTGRQILLPEYPQLIGAIGAALYARDVEAVYNSAAQPSSEGN